MGETDNFFINELELFYENKGKCISANVIKVLGQTPEELNDEGRRIYRTYVLPSSGEIKEALSERIRSGAASLNEWEASLTVCENTIIGNLAREVIAECKTANISSETEVPCEKVDEEYINCPRCNRQIRKTARYCENCGQSLLSSESFRCPACYAECAIGKKYCSNCGCMLDKPDNLTLPQFQHLQRPNILYQIGNHIGGIHRRWRVDRKDVAGVLFSIFSLVLIVVVIIAAIPKNSKDNSIHDSQATENVAEKKRDTSSLESSLLGHWKGYIILPSGVLNDPFENHVYFVRSKNGVSELEAHYLYRYLDSNEKGDWIKIAYGNYGLYTRDMGWGKLPIIFEEYVILQFSEGRTKFTQSQGTKFTGYGDGLTWIYVDDQREPPDKHY